MTDFKEQMIRNIERDFTTPELAYDYTRDQMLDAADMARLRAKEHPPETPTPPLPGRRSRHWSPLPMPN